MSLRLSLILFFLSLRAIIANSVGVYFGTFDPPHNGHLGVVLAALQELQLDKVYMLPNVKPSTKIHSSSFDHRYSMVELIALREPGIEILDKNRMIQIYKKNPAEYISDMLEEVRAIEGVDSHLYHICGTDSFLKMDEYNKLPKKDEQRIIAVLPRTGYELKWSSAMLEARKRAQVVVLSGNTRHLSSTKLRKSFFEGKLPNPLDLKDYIQSYIRSHGLYSYQEPELSFSKLLDIQLENYNTQFMRLPDRGHSEVEKVEALSSLNPEEWRESMTLRVDDYMKSHFPAPILDLVRKGIPTTIVADLLPRSLSSLRQLGFHYLVGWFPQQNRIRYAYMVAYKDKKPHLIITHLFGKSRLLHLTYQFSRYRALLGLDDPVEVYRSVDYNQFGANLIAQSIGGLKASKCSVAILGYRGAFKHLFSDVLSYLDQNPNIDFSQLKLSELDKFVSQNGRLLLSPKEEGSRYFPFYQYQFETAFQSCQIVSTRNLYGDQTRLFIEALEGLGFRNFVLFGNSGGLSEEVEIGKVYAPYSRNDVHENQAGVDYPRASAASVASVMEETQYWLDMLKKQGVQLVDVEMEHALAYASKNDLSFYAGLLVSDKPGGADITHKNEDDQDMIQAKRGFFLKVLQRVYLAAQRSK